MLNTQKYKYKNKLQMESSYEFIEKQLKEKYTELLNKNCIALVKDATRMEVRFFYDIVILNKTIVLEIPYYDDDGTANLFDVTIVKKG